MKTYPENAETLDALRKRIQEFSNIFILRIGCYKKVSDVNSKLSNALWKRIRYDSPMWAFY